MFFKKKNETKNMSEELTNVLKGTTRLLEQINENIKPKEPDIVVHTEDEKRRAAYALNLCMVSISQIIDYDDLNILEQEYDGILNNLNLEKMPKDEALLKILKQILDTVTFFRLQEGDRKFIDIEYQQKMKNAIWSAVPNFGMIVGTGSPATMLISLATQVGIGYMNYRKEKAAIDLERDKVEWQLQRSAMEQFNGLRRELFDTAWRLADEYKFPDNFRLTERQIKQYNEILMDENIIRRYERLKNIEENFEAYYPFWYFVGHTAALIYYENKDKDERLANEYKENAMVHFKKYLEISEHNKLLREDEIDSSCALEYIALLDSEKENNVIKDNIKRAIKSSGGKSDVLQLCAFAYMKIDEKEDVMKLLRVLVNEEYNTTVNAQLLSGMYAIEYSKGDSAKKKDYAIRYDTLRCLVGEKCLIPLPKTGGDKKDYEEFAERQKDTMIEFFAAVFKAFFRKYSSIYKQAESMDAKFSVLNEFIDRIKEAPCVEIEDLRNFYDETTSVMKKNQSIITKGATGELLKNNEKEKIRFEVIVLKAYKNLFKAIVSKQNGEMDMQDITDMESRIIAFSHSNGLDEINTAVVQVEIDDECEDSMGKLTYGISVFGDESLSSKLNEYNDMKKAIKKYKAEDLLGKRKKFEFSKCNEPKFDAYLKRRKIGSYCVAVFNDKTSDDYDLIFTTEGIMIRSRIHRIRNRATIPYSKVEKSDNDSEIILNYYGSKYSYDLKGLDSTKVWALIDEFKNISDTYSDNSGEGLDISSAIDEAVQDARNERNKDTQYYPNFILC